MKRWKPGMYSWDFDAEDWLWKKLDGKSLGQALEQACLEEINDGCAHLVEDLTVEIGGGRLIVHAHVEDA
jgi:hypothetical protein